MSAAEGTDKPPRAKYTQLSNITKNRILEAIRENGYCPALITRELNAKGYKFCVSTLRRFYERYKERGTTARARGSGRPSKITRQLLQVVQEEMHKNHETTARHLYNILLRKGWKKLSLSTVLRARKLLGWKFGGTKYAQAIRAPNVPLRLDHAKKWERLMRRGFGFRNMIFIDESKVQIERHTRKCCRRVGFPMKYSGRHKHPLSVMVWAGISREGRTDICIFRGIMRGPFYCRILREYLIPSAEKLYPDGEWDLMQDNDPKHTSILARQVYEDKGISWMKTPAESPDLNPMENIFAELKWYLRKMVKPKTQDGLIHGIKKFWRTVDKEKCDRYINHLYKVVPAIIAKEGFPSGY